MSSDPKPAAVSRKRVFSDYVRLSLKGFAMGASDVVPGVSGGTMAFILGIYEELIDAIRSFDGHSLGLLLRGRLHLFLNHTSWRFLLAVGTGILVAVLTLARGLEWLLINQPVLIWSFFFGLILASVLSVSRRVGRWNGGRWVSLALGTLGTYVVVGLVPLSTTNAPWFVFLCGALAICAMILPGISGSFILVLLGKYQYVLHALNQRDFVVLLLVTAGACSGIVLFSRILGWLLNRYHDLMVALLIGLMLGSLRKVWPWKKGLPHSGTADPAALPQVNVLPPAWDTELLGALSLMAAGFVLVLLLDRLSTRG